MRTFGGFCQQLLLVVALISPAHMSGLCDWQFESTSVTKILWLFGQRFRLSFLFVLPQRRAARRCDDKLLDGCQQMALWRVCFSIFHKVTSMIIMMLLIVMIMTHICTLQGKASGERVWREWVLVQPVDSNQSCPRQNTRGDHHPEFVFLDKMVEILDGEGAAVVENLDHIGDCLCLGNICHFNVLPQTVFPSQGSTWKAVCGLPPWGEYHNQKHIFLHFHVRLTDSWTESVWHGKFQIRSKLKETLP